MFYETFFYLLRPGTFATVGKYPGFSYYIKTPLQFWNMEILNNKILTLSLLDSASLTNNFLILFVAFGPMLKISMSSTTLSFRTSEFSERNK